MRKRLIRSSIFPSYQVRHYDSTWIYAQDGAFAPFNKRQTTRDRLGFRPTGESSEVEKQIRGV